MHNQKVIEKLAGLIANTNIMRNGSPPFSNPLDILPDNLKLQCKDDAEYILRELEGICICSVGETTGNIEIDGEICCNRCGKLQFE